jgi:hypothetical protein
MLLASKAMNIGTTQPHVLSAKETSCRCLKAAVPYLTVYSNYLL